MCDRVLQNEKEADAEETLSSFHGGSAESYQQSLPQDATVVSVPVSQGHAIFHHQNVWHGSGPNRSTIRHRRALVGHYLRGDVEFKQDSGERRGEREVESCRLLFY